MSASPEAAPAVIPEAALASAATPAPAATSASALTTLARAAWEPLAAAHAARADRSTAGHRERAGRGQKHAVEDFLYEYYSTRPAHLRRWHPGVGVALEDAAEHATWRWYASDGTRSWVDARAFIQARGATVDFVLGLMRATAARPMQLGCFGLHEWAMVYRADATRHPLPLRLGARETDAVVEANALVCTHFDAYRFFTQEAVPRNATVLERSGQVTREQPGCLHATMDLYKWCAKLAPAVPSTLQQDCFELALEVRQVDMQASPYDVSGLGLTAIAIETPEGKREYAARQRDFAARGAVLRERLVAACEAIHAAA